MNVSLEPPSQGRVVVISHILCMESGTIGLKGTIRFVMKLDQISKSNKAGKVASHSTKRKHHLRHRR